MQQCSTHATLLLHTRDILTSRTISKTFQEYGNFSRFSTLKEITFCLKHPILLQLKAISLHPITFVSLFKLCTTQLIDSGWRITILFIQKKLICSSFFAHDSSGICGTILSFFISTSKNPSNDFTLFTTYP